MIKKKNISKTSDTKLKSFKEFKSKDVKIKGYFTIIIFLALLLFDRLTKVWATNIDNIDYGIVAFTYATNTGAGFSIMQNMNLLLAIISAIAFIALIYFRRYVPKFSALTIAAGICGNLIDRVFYGSVIDFINFKIWPIFNIADSLIFVGVIYWIIIILMDGEKNGEKNSKENNKKNKNRR